MNWLRRLDWFQRFVLVGGVVFAGFVASIISAPHRDQWLRVNDEKLPGYDQAWATPDRKCQIHERGKIGSLVVLLRFDGTLDNGYQRVREDVVFKWVDNNTIPRPVVFDEKAQTWLLSTPSSLERKDFFKRDCTRYLTELPSLEPYLKSVVLAYFDQKFDRI